MTASLAGCVASKPDLTRLYSSLAETPKEYPLIVIPGIMGSRLIDPETEQEHAAR